MGEKKMTIEDLRPMIGLDGELAVVYLSECREQLATVETDLLAMEKSGAAIDEELVNRAFRAIHSINGGAGFFDLVKIRELAQRTEDVLALIRARRIAPNPERIRVLLHATGTLGEMIDCPRTSNRADTDEIMAALVGMCSDQRAAAELSGPAGMAPRNRRDLRVLLVEDDFSSRLLLQTFLMRFGECHVAINGREAVDAVCAAFARGQRYDLICMDILMPEMDGREAVRQVRALEESHGILSTSGAKIIMTTKVNEIRDVIQCFKDLCDAYLLKPIDLGKLLGHMKAYGLTQ